MNRPNNNKSLGSRSASFAATIALLGGSTVATIAMSPAGAFAQSTTAKHSNGPADLYIREVGSDYTRPYSPTAVTPDVPPQYADAGSGSYAGGNATVAQDPASSRIASHNVDGIMSRIAAMFTTAQSHAGAHGVPSTARDSYRTAASSLQRALAAGHVRINGSSIGSYANIPISSFQLADDIRTLRAEAQTAKPAQAAKLNQIAILYAAGAKEFFTATLRDALLRPVNASRYAANGTGSVSSALMPEARRSTTSHVPGSQQTGGVLQPDGTVAPVSIPPDGAGFQPSTLPTANDSILVAEPFPFNTSGITDVEAYPDIVPVNNAPTIVGPTTNESAPAITTLPPPINP